MKAATTSNEAAPMDTTEPDEGQLFGVARGHVFIDSHGVTFLAGHSVRLTRPEALMLALRGTIVAPALWADAAASERRTAAEALFDSIERERVAHGWAPEPWEAQPQHARLYQAVIEILKEER